MSPSSPAITTVDLHLHSLASDGDHRPAELAELAARAGVTVASCTDHNTWAATDEFTQAFERLGGRSVVGCEVSTTWLGQETHLLVYGPVGSHFVRQVEAVRQEHLATWHRWVDKAAELGIPVTWESVEAQIGKDRIPYFGELLRLLRRAAADDERFRAYDASDLMAIQRDWFEPGRPLYVPEPAWPDLADLVEAARDSGGVPVLAHPGQALASLPDPRMALKRLCQAGLVGLEAWTTWHRPPDTAETLALCTDLGLVPTQGSDFHGTRIKAWATSPGFVPGAPADPASLLDALFSA